MADNTNITWTRKDGKPGATWNPWYGCTKVSTGCKNCYMDRWAKRAGRDPEVVRRAAAASFFSPYRIMRRRPGSFVFTCSLSDWFHQAADSWRTEAWDIIRHTRSLTYQILTKRPERIKDHLPADWGTGYRNVWLGVSAEDQRTAELRVPILRKVPAAIRFLSLEPLLGPIDLERLLPKTWEQERTGEKWWVIVGGESGPGRRPLDLKWLEAIWMDCSDLGIPLWVKQDSGQYPGQQGRIPDWLWTQERPEQLTVA